MFLFQQRYNRGNSSICCSGVAISFGGLGRQGAYLTPHIKLVKPFWCCKQHLSLDIRVLQYSNTESNEKGHPLPSTPYHLALPFFITLYETPLRHCNTN